MFCKWRGALFILGLRDAVKKKIEKFGGFILKGGGVHFRNPIFYTFYLGHFSEEGVGQRLNFSIFNGRYAVLEILC